jgi:hypothetical protein
MSSFHFLIKNSKSFFCFPLLPYCFFGRSFVLISKMQVMKKLLVCLLVLCAVTASAQVKKKNNNGIKKNKTVIQKNTKNDKSSIAISSPTVLTNTASYTAKFLPPVSLNRSYSIADPTVLALNARANGANIKISNSGIVGMPKRAYGFANGKLSFSSTAATSSGTITGSGVVGTGSSLGSIGSYGSGTALNGKSPQAGLAMWGNATGLIVKEKQ